GFGIVMPSEIDPAAMRATRATLEMLAKLDVRIVIPGHGEPFTDVAAALDRAFRRLEALEADSLRTARHILKSLLTFSLLDKQRMLISALPVYLDRVEVCRVSNARFFRIPPAELAERLLGELEHAGAMRREDGWLRPG